MNLPIELSTQNPRIKRLHQERQQLTADMEAIRQEMMALKETMRCYQQRMRGLNGEMLRCKRTPLSVVVGKPLLQKSPSRAQLTCLEGGK